MCSQAPTGDGATGAAATQQQQAQQARRKGGDILSMLISIYGSKDLFVSEYRLMLADKLLRWVTWLPMASSGCHRTPVPAHEFASYCY